MDLMYLLYSLLRKKWIILFCSALGVVAGFIFTLSREKEYVSLAQYSTGFTMEQRVKISQEENFNIYEIDLRFNNMIETFRSPKVMGMLSSKLLLHDLEGRPFRELSPEKLNSPAYKTVNKNTAIRILKEKIAAMELLNPFDVEEKKVYDLIKLYGYDADQLYGKLNFDRAGRTDFINIFCRSENPELSAFVVNTIGDQFIRFFNSIYGKRSKEASGKLDSLITQKKKEVDTLTERLRRFREKIGPSSGTEKAVGAMQIVTDMGGSARELQSDLNNQRGELEAVEEQLRNLGPAVASTNTANSNKEILRLKNRNSFLETQKSGRADKDKSIQDEIDKNMQRIIDLGSQNGNSRSTAELESVRTKRDQLISRRIELQQQIAASQRNVDLATAEKKKYERLIFEGGGADVLLQQMTTEQSLAQKEYENLRQSAQSSLDLDVNPENDFKQTLAGQPAYKAEPSKRMLILALAGTLMFFLSSFIVLLLEFLDSSYKTPSFFQRTTKLKLLSSINKIDLRRKELKDYFHANGEVDSEKEAGIFVENLRKLRFELERTGKKIFLVTSTRPKEGKTIIIESLANSLSLSKKKVLLIDANFSHNTLTQKFGAKPTLEQFSVNGQPNIADKFWNITSMTSIPNTDIVGCQEGNFTPAEVLPKNNLFENLSRISDSYDFIFIEGAALNTHADSKELSRYVDGIVAVFSARSVLRHTDKDSIQYLKSTGEKFVGSVLNQVEVDNLEM